MNSEWDPRASPGELGHLPSYLPSRASCCVPPPILVNSAMKQDKNILPVSPTGVEHEKLYLTMRSVTKQNPQTAAAIPTCMHRSPQESRVGTGEGVA